MGSVVETNFSPTSPHFFTIILQDTLRNNKLKIPKKILRKCGNSLRDEVFLKLPCGSKWKLGLRKSCEGKVWMEKGWPEFSKKYSIGRGYLLVFRYEGNSQFHVVIFDTTTTDIDYPLEKHIGTETPKHEKFVEEEEICNDGTEDDISVENLDCPFPRPCSKTRDKLPLSCLRPQKRTRNSPVKGQSVFSDNSTSSLRLSMKEKAQALKRASGFKSIHPFFMLVMGPSHVQARYDFNIPTHFAVSYLGTSKQVILKSPDERTWFVNYHYSKLRRKTSRAKFLAGWKAFALDNDLKRGDVCVFVMAKTSGTILFEVSIFRKDGTTNSASVPGLGLKPGQRTSLSTEVEFFTIADKKSLATNRNHRALAISASFQSDNPFFTSVIHPSYTTKGPFKIPANFGRTYMEKNKGQISLCVSDGRSWSVQYRLRPYQRMRQYELQRGWLPFLRESGLEEGDICTFELTNREKLSFKVHIVKVAHEEYQQVPLALRSEETKPVRPES